MRDRRRKPGVPVALLLAVAGAALLSHPAPARAAAFRPFGGPILAITVCALPAAGFLLHIGPPRDGDFLLIPGATLLYSFFTIRVGAQTLGLAGPDELGCFIRVRRGLRLVGEGAPILIMGTSL